MVDRYSVRMDRHGRTTTIRLGGEIDIAAERDVRAAVADSILDDPPPERLVIDLTDTTFLGSTGLNALVLARYATRFVGAVLQVGPCPPQVVRVIELSGLDRYLNVRPAAMHRVSAG